MWLLEWPLLAMSFVPFAITVANMFLWRRVSHGMVTVSSAVSVVIPARNEADNITPCIHAVLQQGMIVHEVLVYDDHSTDNTAEQVDALSAIDRRVVRVSPEPLPEGWCGKTFACHAAANRATGEWILFLDADARLEPGAISNLCHTARNCNATLLSSWPAIIMESFWERLLMPLLNFTVFSIYPAPLAQVRKDVSLGLAHGACILVHRQTYEACGGHEAVKGAIFEDTELARHWLRSGHRSLCVDGQDAVQVRMYESLHGIWTGFQKNFFPAFRRPLAFWLFLSFHFVVFLLPFPVVLGHLAGVFGFSIWAYAAAIAVLFERAFMAIRFGYPWWPVLLHPIAETMFIALGLQSWRAYRSGGGVEWKGRRYPAGK